VSNNQAENRIADPFRALRFIPIIIIIVGIYEKPFANERNSDGEEASTPTRRLEEGN